MAYYNINQRSEALKCYEEVVAYDPQSSAALEAMRGIREIYVGEGRIDDYFAYAERSGVQSDMSAAARDSLSHSRRMLASLRHKLHSAPARAQRLGQRPFVLLMLQKRSNRKLRLWERQLPLSP